MITRLRNWGMLSLALGLLVVAGFMALPGLAAAIVVGPRLELVQPPDGSIDVPRNARIWLGHSSLELGHQFRWFDWLPLDVDLLDEEGTSVEAGQTVISEEGGRWVLVLTPASLLDAGASYQVIKGSNLLSTFAVGTTILDEAPTAPRLEVIRTDSTRKSDSGGASRWVVLGVEAPESSVLVLIDEGERAGSSFGDLDGTVASLTSGEFAIIGTGGGWPDAKPGATTEVRALALDIAGNASEPGESVEVRMPLFSSFSCAATTGSGWIALLLLLPWLVGRAGWQPRRQAQDPLPKV